MSRRIVAGVAAITFAVWLGTTGPAAAAPSEPNRVADPGYCMGVSEFYDGPYRYHKPTLRTDDHNTDCYLYEGISNGAVWMLQVALNLCYHQGLEGDGIYGPKTAAAVRNVEAFHGLSVNGVYDPGLSWTMAWPKDIHGFWKCWDQA